jgi:hypothetical protein
MSLLGGWRRVKTARLTHLGQGHHDHWGAVYELASGKLLRHQGKSQQLMLYRRLTIGSYTPS